MSVFVVLLIKEGAIAVAVAAATGRGELGVSDGDT